VPPCGPGQLTTSPSDCELYGRGYIEVPRTGAHGNCGPHGLILGPHGSGYEALPGEVKETQQPVQPMPPMTTRGASTRVPPVVSTPAPSPAYRGGTVGTGVNPSTKGGSVKLAQPASTTRKPSSGLQPALIGPLGYDDLR
jgi:pilus assembly protein CpaC